jgi:predicted DNA-binding transcriptional regulator YafY
MGGHPPRPYRRHTEVIHQVNRAVMERRVIDIAYRPLRSSERVPRKVEPYKVWFYDGTIYIIGWCRLRRDVRTFVLDRIKLLQLTEETFTVPADFSFEDYVRHSFKVMVDELYAVKILISPAWSRYMGERIWHESQEIQKRFDGSIEITFRVAGLDEIARWVLGLGPEAFVLEPEELKQKVQEQLQSSLHQYKTGTPHAHVDEPPVLYMKNPPRVG